MYKMDKNYMPSEAKSNNEQYMQKGMKKGVMGHDKQPGKISGMKSEPMSKKKMNKGYPSQAYDYKY